MPEALIMGAGNIGRGVVGYLLDQAGYRLHFFDIDYSRLQAIKQRERYHVYLAEEPVRKVTIKNFDIVGSEALVDKLTTCTLTFCCVYEGAFASIAESIVAAMRQRLAQRDMRPLNVMLCVNSIDAPLKMQRLLNVEVGKDALLQDYLNQYVGINQVMVLSAGLPLPEVYAHPDEDDVMITAAPHLEIDWESFKGPQPQIEAVSFVTNAEGRLKRKVFVGNMRHTMAGFMGANLHLDFIYQAQMQLEVRAHLIGAFEEAHTAVTREFTFEATEDAEWVAYMMDKLDQKVEDKITRVIASPERKLADGERFIASARLCLKHQILPDEICLGVAYGVRFLQQQTGELRTTATIVQEVCGLDPVQDFVLTQLIEKHLAEIERKLN